MGYYHTECVGCKACIKIISNSEGWPWSVPICARSLLLFKESPWISGLTTDSFPSSLVKDAIRPTANPGITLTNKKALAGSVEHWLDSGVKWPRDLQEVHIIQKCKRAGSTSHCWIYTFNFGKLVFTSSGEGWVWLHSAEFESGASNLETMDSRYVGGHPVFCPPRSHSPHF